MCWTSNNIKIETAEEDIPVWKVVHKVNCDQCRSFYSKYMYIKNRYAYTPICITISNNGHIEIEGNKGFHSYSNKLRGIDTIDGIDVIMGWKSSTENALLTGYLREDNIKMAKFIIPKGFQYLENEIGEIISNAIVFDGFIE